MTNNFVDHDKMSIAIITTNSNLIYTRICVTLSVTIQEMKELEGIAYRRCIRKNKLSVCEYAFVSTTLRRNCMLSESAPSRIEYKALVVEYRAKKNLNMFYSLW